MDRITRWFTRQPSESVSEIEPESSGRADSGAHALGDKFHRKINDSVFELYRPSTADIDIDIVFFHGFQLKQDATPYLSTWRARDAERSLWPSKWLAEDYPTARILSVQYVGSMKKTDREGRMDLYLVAELLLHSLLLARVGQSRPVILVGHSFGGIVIKQLCVFSHAQAQRGKSTSGFTFFKNITGICFYATPRRGSRLADVDKFDSQEGELVSVVRRVHSTELARLFEDFECLLSHRYPWDIDITSMGEILPSDMDEGRYVIVEEASARHPGAFTVLPEDHFSICQPRERTNTSYKTLVDFILQVQQKRRNFSIHLPQGVSKICNELYEIYAPVAGSGVAKLEVVFIHGLQSDVSDQTSFLSAWSVRGDPSNCWLKSWLPNRFPESRIICVSYDASPVKTSSQGTLDMFLTAESLVHSLVNLGEIGQSCPVILVGHSLGGLVATNICNRVQKVASYSGADQIPYTKFRDNIKGLFFYSTPFKGLSSFWVSKEKELGDLMSSLLLLDTATARSNEDFGKLRATYGWETRGVLESSETTLRVEGVASTSKNANRFVCEASARVPFVETMITLRDTDHFTVCRPETEQSSNFLYLVKFLESIIRKF
ncbi:hypothetical protein R1flu_025780 [Riccia fluitans]|uniref:AB hydrolase-1 domain-containing protein n=1 Tax=Riccia fluitans TaxID=41844 RepID=A0ABD1XZM3_9MARC